MMRKITQFVPSIHVITTVLTPPRLLPSLHSLNGATPQQCQRLKDFVKSIGQMRNQAQATGSSYGFNPKNSLTSDRRSSYGGGTSSSFLSHVRGGQQGGRKGRALSQSLICGGCWFGVFE